MEAKNILKQNKLVDGLAKKIAHSPEIYSKLAEGIANDNSNHLESDKKIRKRIIKSIITDQDFRITVLKEVRNKFNDRTWLPGQYYKIIMRVNELIGFKGLVNYKSSAIDLLKDYEIVDEVITRIAANLEVVDELTEDVVEEISMYLEDEPEISKKIIKSVTSNLGFKKRIVAEIIKKPRVSKNAN